MMHLVSIFCAAGKIRYLKKYKFVLHSCRNISIQIFKNYLKNLKHNKTIHFKILKQNNPAGIFESHNGSILW